jgi:hypothetical protein
VICAQPITESTTKRKGKKKKRRHLSSKIYNKTCLQNKLREDFTDFNSNTWSQYKCKVLFACWFKQNELKEFNLIVLALFRFFEMHDYHEWSLDWMIIIKKLECNWLSIYGHYKPFSICWCKLSSCILRFQIMHLHDFKASLLNKVTFLFSKTYFQRVSRSLERATWKKEQIFLQKEGLLVPSAPRPNVAQKKFQNQ